MSAQLGLIKNRLAGWRVLIAEDDQDAMRIASRFLNLAGAELFAAENGQVALKMAHQHHPWLVITDLHMPLMDGWQLCEAIKADEAIKDIPVIALTADFSSQATRQAQQIGFAGFIRKPLDPHKFVEQVLEIIQTMPELAARLP
jgi:CheY-like chemotaxis protein